MFESKTLNMTVNRGSHVLKNDSLLMKGLAFPKNQQMHWYSLSVAVDVDIINFSKLPSDFQKAKPASREDKKKCPN